MIVNNKLVQGIFIYNQESSNIEFTKGDLVVSGDCIYVCDAETVSGIDPATDTSFEYFQLYPGSKIITASEFFTYIRGGGEVEDKYVSSQAIMGILQGYQFGLDMEGVISDWIDKNGDTTLRISSLTDRPLDNLMLTETLNRGMVKVSKELSQIVDGKLGNDGTPFSVLFGVLEKEGVDYDLILSQYTYKSSSIQSVRVQEMCSPLTGVTVYRYMTWNTEDFPSNGNVISSWRSVYNYSSSIKSKIGALESYYGNLANNFKARVASVVGSFRFKEVFSGTSETSEVNNLGEGVYTVCVRGVNSDNHYISESVVVRLGGNSSYDLYFNNIPNSHLTISYGSGKYRIRLVGSGVSLVSVYGREEFSL